MNEQSIEVIVGKAGEVDIEAIGFTGPACEAATKFLEEALGQVTAKNLTGDFFQVENEQQRESI